MSAEIVTPNETARAEAFELWMQAPHPMVTVFLSNRVMARFITD